MPLRARSLPGESRAGSQYPSGRRTGFRRGTAIVAVLMLMGAIGLDGCGGGRSSQQLVSLWPVNQDPGASDAIENRPVELGVRFYADVSGTVQGIRFYKGRFNTGPHTGTLWSDSGERLATASFERESESGWQEVRFSAVAVERRKLYVASYHTTVGRYTSSQGFFVDNGRDNGLLHAPAGDNGVFRYGAGGFPTETYRSSNYWVDILFAPAAGASVPPTPATGTAAPSGPAPNASTSAAAPGRGLGPPTTSTVGPEYYRRWTNGPSSDPDHFPIGVWMQDPRRTGYGRDNALNYRDIGINMFIRLYQWPPDEGRLDLIRAAGETALAGGDEGDTVAVDVAKRLPSASALDGYVLFDEPDQNQANGTSEGGGCVLPSAVNAAAARVRSADPTRPIYINFGKGLALGDFKGRGPGCWTRDSVADGYEYVKACDICSVDYYALSDPYEPPHNKGLWVYGRSIDRMVRFVGGKKPVWGFVEVTKPENNSTTKAVPSQVRSMVWMSLIHGAMGIEYFAHSFAGGLQEDALLQDEQMAATVRVINAQIQELAPVLNSRTILGGIEISGNSSPIDTMVKLHDGATYVLSIEGKGSTTGATFTIPGRSSGTVSVLGENRTLQLSGGSFRDVYDPYQVHLYKVT